MARRIVVVVVFQVEFGFGFEDAGHATRIASSDQAAAEDARR